MNAPLIWLGLLHVNRAIVCKYKTLYMYYIVLLSPHVISPLNQSCQKACDKPASVIDEHSHTLVKSKKVNSFIMSLKCVDLSDIHTKILQNFLSVNIESAAKTKIKRPPSQHQATSVTSCDRELSKYKRGVVPD